MALVQNPKRCGAKSVLHHGAKPILHQDQIYWFWHRGRGFTTKPHPFGPKMVLNRGGNVNFLENLTLVQMRDPEICNSQVHENRK